MKPAGFEPDDVRSGYTWKGIGAYREFRDHRVAFFVRALPPGKHNLCYRLRAEIPGKLPGLGFSGLAPQVLYCLSGRNSALSPPRRTAWMRRS